MNSMRRSLWLLVFVCASVSTMFGQINPAKDLTWTKLTGAGAPVSGACTSSNYGQPYTDTTSIVQYWCGPGGWFTITTGSGGGISATAGTILKAVTSTTAGNSAVSDIAGNVTSTEPINGPSFVGTDTAHNGHTDLTSVGTAPAGPGTSTIQFTVPNAVTSYQMVWPGTGPVSGNGLLSCTPPVSSKVVCSWVANVDSKGTAFSVSGCSAGSPTGGETAGKFQSGTSGTCTVTVTMGDAETAAHGWICGEFTDLTTNADTSSWNQTATTTTTATMSGTTATNDFVQFGCRKY